MRNPQITTTVQKDDGSKYFYIEQDSALINLKQTFKTKFGPKPFIFIKMVSSPENQDKFSRDGHLGNVNITSLRIYLKVLKSGSSHVYEDIGTLGAISGWCDGGSFITTGVVTKETASFRADKQEFTNVTTQLSAKPILERQGVINQNDAGQDSNAIFTNNGVGVSKDNTGLVFDYNSSRDDILRRWNDSVANRRPGDTSNRLSIFLKDAKGVRKEVTDFQQLQAAFPLWFMINGEFLSKGLASITGDKIEVHGGKVYPASYTGLWQKYAKEGLSEKELVNQLISKGYSAQQINATRTRSGLTPYQLSIHSSGTKYITNQLSTEKLNLAPLVTDPYNPNNPGGGSGVGGGGRSPDGRPIFGPEGFKPGVVQNVTVGRSRSILLTSEQVNAIVSYDHNQQVMYQVYIDSVDSSGTAKPVLNQYLFDFSPNEINYSGFGSEWISIERSGTFPIVDWKSFRLMNIGFSFVIANNNNDFTAEGLESPVTQQIDTLQRMAQSPYPVMFYGFDKLLTNQFRYDSQGNPRGIQFVIQDFTLSAQRRNAKMEITRAQASLTLQEIPIETTAIIGMPRLVHKPGTPPPPPPTIGEPGFGLFTDHLEVQGTDTLSYRA